MYNCNLDIDSEDKRPASFINNENLGEISNNVLPPNKDLAYKFIDFIIDEKNYAKIGNKTGYAISNEISMKYINDNDLSNTITYPNQKNLLNSEILLDNENTYMNIVENFENFKKEYIKTKDLNEK
mgnify:CR=1 FL=1